MVFPARYRYGTIAHNVETKVYITMSSGKPLRGPHTAECWKRIWKKSKTTSPVFLGYIGYRLRAHPRKRIDYGFPQDSMRHLSSISSHLIRRDTARSGQLSQDDLSVRGPAKFGLAPFAYVYVCVEKARSFWQVIADEMRRTVSTKNT